jgi:dimethylhistidine N-methyltransferase
LFAKITTLDAYYPTRLELELLDRHLPVIAHHVGPEARVIEPGCGEPVKATKLLHALERPLSYVGIDVSREPLERTARELRAELPRTEIQTLAADYTQPFELPSPQHEWRRSLVFFPGSTIGNFEPGAARSFLAMLGRIAGDERLLLLGADATRDPTALVRAYDDDHGVTEAFDKNVLLHLNRTRGATFDPDAFVHRAEWNAAASRIEMQLVSTRHQLVQIAGEVVAIGDGEPIVTEHCYKHTPAAMQALLAAAGWRTRQVFTSPERPYRLWLCEPNS